MTMNRVCNLLAVLLIAAAYCLTETRPFHALLLLAVAFVLLLAGKNNAPGRRTGGVENHRMSGTLEGTRLFYANRTIPQLPSRVGVSAGRGELPPVFEPADVCPRTRALRRVASRRPPDVPEPVHGRIQQEPSHGVGKSMEVVR